MYAIITKTEIKTDENACIVEDIDTAKRHMYDSASEIIMNYIKNYIIDDDEYHTIKKSHSSKEICLYATTLDDSKIKVELHEKGIVVIFCDNSYWSIEILEVYPKQYVNNDKKFKLTSNRIYHCNTTVYQIEAIKNFGNIRKGDKGGYVESERNLSQNGNCWIYGSAVVKGNARVSQNSSVRDRAIVTGNVSLYDNVTVKDDAYINGDIELFNSVTVGGKTNLSGRGMITVTINIQ